MRPVGVVAVHPRPGPAPEVGALVAVLGHARRATFTAPGSSKPSELIDIDAVRHRGGVPRSVHRQGGVQLVLGFWHLVDLAIELTWPRQHPFGSGTSPYPASYAGRPAEGPAVGVPVFCCLSATGVRFLAILCPLGNWASLTVGLPALSQSRTPTGLSRFARVRYGRGGCPLYPGDCGALHGRHGIPGRRTPLLNGEVPVPRRNTPPSEASANEASSRVRGCSPVRPSPRL